MILISSLPQDTKLHSGLNLSSHITFCQMLILKDRKERVHDSLKICWVVENLLYVKNCAKQYSRTMYDMIETYIITLPRLWQSSFWKKQFVSSFFLKMSFSGFSNIVLPWFSYLLFISLLAFLSVLLIRLFPKNLLSTIFFSFSMYSPDSPCAISRLQKLLCRRFPNLRPW